VFTSIAASRYFSAATTAAGQVFTWGSGFSGELGFDGHSWVTVAREVDGVIREVFVLLIVSRGCCNSVASIRATCSIPARAVVWQAIADNGGASKVVTGSGGFCACLTSSGRSVP